MSNSTLPLAAEPTPAAAAASPSAAPDGSRAAFLQESADALLSSLVPTGEPPAPPRPQPAPVDAMMMLAQSVMEAQAPRPQYADFATVPANNPFGAPASGSQPGER